MIDKELPEIINKIVKGNTFTNRYYFNGDNECFIEINSENKKSLVNDIVEKRNFSNGYKVIKLWNGLYSYKREKDDFLMPYKFTIATDFNKYGFAMVVKNGNLTWINDNFEMLVAINNDGKPLFKFVNIDELKNFNKLFSIVEISNFNDGDVPLSKIVLQQKYNKFQCSSYKTSYLNIDGTIKKFYKYDGSKLSESYTNYFDGRISDELNFTNGYSIIDEKLIFSKGYYIDSKDIIKCIVDVMNNDIISKIEEKAVSNELKKIAKVQKLKK